MSINSACALLLIVYAGSSTDAAASPQQEVPRVAKVKRVTLTAEQKRQKHLDSEKKRRDTIKESFKQLVQLVQVYQTERFVRVFTGRKTLAHESIAGLMCLESCRTKRVQPRRSPRKVILPIET